MQIYDSGTKRGKQVQEFGSTGVKMAALMNARAWHIVAVQLDPGGVLGAHKATEDQVLIVVEGSGRVSSGGGKPVDVAPGSTVFWNQGEVHETRAGDQGLTAILVEGEKLERTLSMPVKKITG